VLPVLRRARLTSDPEWFKRYGSRIENFNLPKTEAARRQFATVIGSDGKRLLNAIEVSEARAPLPKLPSVILLQRVWDEQFVEDGVVSPNRRNFRRFAVAAIQDSPTAGYNGMLPPVPVHS